MRIFFYAALLVVIMIVACNGSSDNAAKLEHGKTVYQTYCQGCHMDDGGGVPNLNAPLAASAYVNGDKTKLINIVLKGSAAFANDPNRTYGNVMASFANLKDDEIADVLSYVRNNFKNNAPAITADEVRSARGNSN